jgi:hypothetical protein
MTESTLSRDDPAGPKRWFPPGVLNLVAAYLFGLTALIILMTAPGRQSSALLLAAPFLCVGIVFLVVGLKKFRRALQQQQGDSAAARPVGAFWTVTTVVVMCVIPISLSVILPSRWRPQLDVKNVGTTAVTFSFAGHDFVTQPGESWHMRFSAGDTLTIRAGQGADAPSQTVKLPERNPKPWTFNPIAQRYTAEVNADDPQNIRFENRRFEEISAPPSASEPWP